MNPLATLEAIGAITTAFIAATGLFVAIWQIHVGRHEARLGVAKSIYKDYLALAFANPRFASASYPRELPAFIEIENPPLEPQ